MKAQNIFLDENTGGKGRYFKARILQPGLVKYSFGVCLLEKETIDKFVNDFVGCPVIIGHQDVTNQNADKLSRGNICHVWYDDKDGWYWVDGIIDNQEALNKIDEGYSVSCQYEITEYSNNTDNKLHNGNPYDKVILNGKPEHLAIVETPRYESAMIAVNALEWKEEEHPRDEDGKFTSGSGSSSKSSKGTKKLTEAEEKEVGVALYTINKEAKKIRDIRQNLKDFLFESQSLEDNTISFLQNKYPKINFDEDGTFVEDNYGSVYRDVDAIDEQIDENQREINYQETKLDDEDEADDAQDEIDAQQEHINELEKLKENLNEVNLHEVLKKVSSEEKEALYELKQKVIKKLNPKEIGIHKFDDDTARKLYQIGDFTFHGEDISDELTQEEYDKLENLGQISQENKLLEEQKIDVDKAKEILSKHLGLTVKNSLDKVFLKKPSNKNTIITHIIKAINELKDTDMFKSLFRKKEQKMNKDEMKQIFAECLQEVLIARNEEDEEKEKAAENEDEELEEELKVEEKAKNKKCKNEDVDKREIIRQIMAIAGKEEASEDVKTIAKLAEKLAYDKSEAATADNGKKAKCEDEEEDKEEAKNKAKNAIDDLKGLFASAGVAKSASKYVSQSDAIELGNQLF